MAHVMIVTVSDDRYGRKDGLYAATQTKIEQFFRNQPGLFGITHFESWTWNRIQNSEFYREHKKQLDHADAAVNGRVYKPLAIVESLKHLRDGDFLIYTDCSPAMWRMPETAILSSDEFDIQVLKNLCVENRGILTAYQPWVPNCHVEDRGYHTHENFTLEKTMEKMGLQAYKYCLQHASGMVVLQKNSRSVQFANDWLYWNSIAECAGLQPFEEKETCTFWIEEFEKYGKIGHRHDQSISGLLLNAMNHFLIQSPCLNSEWFHPITFLQFCRKNYAYRFVSSIKGPSMYTVRNTHQGIKVMLRT